MKVQVEVFERIEDFADGLDPIIAYTMDHNDSAQRRVMGEQIRNAFEAGQAVLTYPVSDFL